MGRWSALFAALAGPLAKRVVVALGFGVVSIVGVRAAIDAAMASVAGAFGGMGAEVGALVARAGFFQAVSIVMGGVVGGLVFMQMKRLGLLGGGA